MSLMQMGMTLTTEDEHTPKRYRKLYGRNVVGEYKEFTEFHRLIPAEFVSFKYSTWNFVNVGVKIEHRRTDFTKTIVQRTPKRGTYFK